MKGIRKTSLTQTNGASTTTPTTSATRAIKRTSRGSRSSAKTEGQKNKKQLKIGKKAKWQELENEESDDACSTEHGNESPPSVETLQTQEQDQEENAGAQKDRSMAGQNNRSEQAQQPEEVQPNDAQILLIDDD